MTNGFSAFFRDHGIIRLTVAVAVGFALQQVAGTLAASMITPLIGAVLSQSELGLKSVTVNESEIYIGAAIDSLVMLLILAAFVYFLIRISRSNRSEQPGAGRE